MVEGVRYTVADAHLQNHQTLIFLKPLPGVIIESQLQNNRPPSSINGIMITSEHNSA